MHLPFSSLDQTGSGGGPGSATAQPSLRDGVDMAKLIGRPHLFGRVKPLRRGFMVEPIGNLVLRPGGRITGHGHPNEGTWAPYEWGEVPSSQAFAFVSGGNGYIPSSTWTQSFGDMPIGLFCDEPEDSMAAQRLCLIPQGPVVPADDPENGVVFLVASCLRFHESTIPALLAQLRAEGIPASRIKVVVNGCARDEDRTIDGVDHAFSTHDGWEWSALYEAPRRWRFGYAFLMHDTNVIFPGFRRSVEEFNRHLAWDHLPASPLARCLLGLYSHDFLTRLNPWLKTTDRISKRDGIIAEAAAEILFRARTALVIGDAERNGRYAQAEWRELVDQFDTGTARVRRAFPAIKLHKFIHAGPAKPDAL
ncbi:hypothetical protein [uncultured Sphingomonas sp.]|uniref:hypothetical protein n=1 Tax=uncultured Sphingomonas sp. TaxID=158754 RepID=UPI0035CC334B